MKIVQFKFYFINYSTKTKMEILKFCEFNQRIVIINEYFIN